MKLTIGTACFNGLQDTKIFWENLLENVADKNGVQLIVVDNGCADGTVQYLEETVFPFFPDHLLISHEQNIGPVPALQEIYKKSDGDVIAMIHNDLFIFEPKWDQRVLGVFERDPKVGMAGTFGATGIGLNGGRVNNFSNMIDAETHLAVRTYGEKEMVVFDGMSLICRREMLDEVGGFDPIYIHHFYDKDISLLSYTHGWKNMLIGLDCQHRGGITAARGDYAKWASEKMKVPDGDQAIYNISETHFLEKWKDTLPVVIP